MNTTFRIAFFLIFAALFGGQIPVVCQPKSMDDAAIKFWVEKNPGRASEKTLQFDHIFRDVDLAVYEKYNPPSFVIMLNTRQGYIPAGYSFRNTFFAAGTPDNQQKNLLEAISEAVREDPGSVRGLKTLSGSLGPLLMTKWGQGKYFNFYCPRDINGLNGRTCVGCVAVAMGQILKYYAGFNSFNTRHEYDCTFYGHLAASLGSYNWKDMEDLPVSVNLSTSRLLSDLGILLDTNYGPTNSTANSHQTLEAFHSLGYIGATLLRRSKFTAESWSELFYENLNAYKPVLVTGGGHAFVCDGYNQEGFFHFNLGWDGYADGFYPLAGVLNLHINEAFTDIEPINWPLPPKEIGLAESYDGSVVTWHYAQGQHPLLSRIYADGVLVTETRDTVISADVFGPGIHDVYVSALYQEGESRWIGPVELFVKGNPLTLSDPLLLQAIRTRLSQMDSGNDSEAVYEGDLSRITSLEIGQPVANIDGLSRCNHLQSLVIKGFTAPPLDANPLENMANLRILEWNGREILHPEILEKLTGLSELRFQGTRLNSLDFLDGSKNLVSFGYSGAEIANPQPIRQLSLLEDLTLSHASLSDAGFLAGCTNLVRLDLSANNLTGSDWMLSLANLQVADLSHNRIPKLLLSGQMKSLSQLNVSANLIGNVTLVSEMNSLATLDLSFNQLTRTGRLFIYTPVLRNLSLKGNKIRTLGNQRCQNLRSLDASDNELITTDWISTQPSLRRINLEHNRISDLAGLTRTHLYKQLEYIGLDKNPISRQSYNEVLPMLLSSVDTVTRPGTFQPLSPCYVVPSNGSRLVGKDVELQWSVDATGSECGYDLYLFRGDTLAPIASGLPSMSAVLAQRPSAAFSWVVATRCSDTVFYSGVNQVVSTLAWKPPFHDDFEKYQEGGSLEKQSDLWFTQINGVEAENEARVVANEFRSGLQSLRLADQAEASLSVEHLDMTYLSLKFSIMIPAGRHREFRMEDMNGVDLRIAWDSTSVGRFYLNDRLCSTFVFDHDTWTEYDLLAHARNNCLFLSAGDQIIFNEPWLVPEGIIKTQFIVFSGRDPYSPLDSAGNELFIDDVTITSADATSSEPILVEPEPVLSVYPNPFKELINVSWPLAGTYVLEITDLTGKQVYSRKVITDGTSPVQLQAGGLKAGIYLLQAKGSGLRPIKIIRLEN